MIDVTTTACLRPEVIKQTYESFAKNLKGLSLKDCRLVINIDPVPKENLSCKKDIEQICESIFGQVLFNFPESPNFTQAVNWCWSTAKSDIILHLEDDWVLEKAIYFDQIVRMFSTDTSIYQIVLKAYNNVYDRCCLSPSFISKEMYAKVGGNLDPNINCEIQLRGKKFGLEMPSPEENIPYQNRIRIYSSNIVVRDIGRKWLSSTKYKKPDKKFLFTTWEET